MRAWRRSPKMAQGLDIRGQTESETQRTRAARGRWPLRAGRESRYEKTRETQIVADGESFQFLRFIINREHGWTGAAWRVGERACARSRTQKSIAEAPDADPARPLSVVDILGCHPIRRDPKSDLEAGIESRPRRSLSPPERIARVSSLCPC